MSAIRNNGRRAEARKKNSLPYGRAIVRNFLRVLGLADEDDQPELPTTTQLNDHITTNEQMPRNAARVQDNVFQATTQQPTFGNRQPLAQVDFSNISPRGAMDPPSSVSTVPDARGVASFFTQKTGTTVDTKTVESMVSELQTTPDKNEKFRFTFTAPSREPSREPSNFFANPNATPTTSSAPSSSKSKKLTRNPNGVYRWEGAGSAKHTRSRNRFASPAFGASPAKNVHLVMKDSGGSGETDHKRRRTGESSTAESSGSSLPFPITASPSTSKVNGEAARSSAPSPPVPAPAASTAAARLRTPAKPTAPVVPSPLRQAWSDASSTSSRDESRRSPTQVKPTKTANFMAELIKETIPPKKPDLSNPYQSASPVGKVGPPRRGTRRPRATGKPAVPSTVNKAVEEEKKQEKKKEEEKDKMDQYSPQAIIEATVPKGSKRSRPPTHFEKTASNGNERVNGDSSSVEKVKDTIYTVEEPEDDGSSRAAKKPKPSLNGNGRPSSFFEKPAPSAADSILIEEIDDVPMSDEGKGKTNGKETVTNGSASAAAAAAAAASASALSSRASFSGLKSIPKEPSKLRFSFQAEGSPASASTSPTSATSTSLPKPSQPMFAPPEPAKFTPPSGGFNFSFKADESVTITEPKTTQLEGKTQETKPLSVEEIKAQVQAMGSKSLPVFSFTFTGTLPSTADHVRARGDVKVLPPSSLPTFDFSEPVAASSSSGFKFDMTPPKNFTPPTFTMDSFSKPSTSHDTPSRAAAPSVTPFNFAAAGMKMEVKANVWTCFCGVSNDNSAAKCIACESPAPTDTPGPAKLAEAPKPAAPAVKGFDFAAAGFKMPAPKSDTWTCAECTLTNPNSATKCGPCGADKPGAPAPAAKPTSLPAPPPVQAFNFAAAGFKMPTVNKDTWTCSECTLSNPNSATKCGPCGADRK